MVGCRITQRRCVATLTLERHLFKRLIWKFYREFFADILMKMMRNEKHKQNECYSNFLKSISYAMGEDVATKIFEPARVDKQERTSTGIFGRLLTYIENYSLDQSVIDLIAVTVGSLVAQNNRYSENDDELILIVSKSITHYSQIIALFSLIQGYDKDFMRNWVRMSQNIMLEHSNKHQVVYKAISHLHLRKDFPVSSWAIYIIALCISLHYTGSESLDRSGGADDNSDIELIAYAFSEFSTRLVIQLNSSRPV